MEQWEKAKRDEDARSVLVLVSLVAVLIGMIALAVYLTPDDYKYNPMTGTSTWTDDDGRKFIQGKSGIPVELKQ